MLNFFREKIDFLDNQLLFFLKERINTLSSLKKKSEKNFNFISKELEKFNKKRSYNVFLTQEWFLDFLNNNFILEDVVERKELNKDFYFFYLQSIESNIYQILLCRFLIAHQVGIYKKKNNIQTLDASRWQELLEDRVKQGKKLKIPKDIICSLMERIHQFSIQLQKNHCG